MTGTERTALDDQAAFLVEQPVTTEMPDGSLYSEHNRLAQNTIHAIEEAPLLRADIEPAQLRFLNDVVTYMPQEVKDKYPEYVVDAAISKVLTANSAMTTLSLSRQSVPAMLLEPNYVHCLNDVEEDRTTSAPISETDDDADDAERYDPYADEDMDEPCDPEVNSEQALQMMQYRQERDERTARANAVAAEIMAHEALKAAEAPTVILGETDDDKYHTELQTVMEVSMASSISLALGRQEQAFIEAAIVAYDPFARRAELAAALLCTTEVDPETNELRLKQGAFREAVSPAACRKELLHHLPMAGIYSERRATTGRIVGHMAAKSHMVEHVVRTTEALSLLAVTAKNLLLH
jgi:hypothetical protein